MHNLEHLPPLERPGAEDVAEGACRVEPVGQGELGHAVRVESVLPVHLEHPGCVETPVCLGQLGEHRELLEEQGQAPGGGIEQDHHAGLDPPAEQLIERAIARLEEGARPCAGRAPACPCWPTMLVPRPLNHSPGI